MKNITLILFAFTVMTSCKYTEAPSAGLAKEMCSCLFISEQSEKYCKLVTKESRVLARWETYPEEQKVVAKGVNYTSMAQMDEDPRFGCTIKYIKYTPENAKEFN
jgi:hypothetical protein